jgi:hypothetical protein
MRVRRGITAALAQNLGCGLVKRLVSDQHAVIGLGRSFRDVGADHVAQHALGFAVQRVTATTTTGRGDANDVAWARCEGIDIVQQARVGLARIEDHLRG